MKVQLKQFALRLRKPSTLLSLISQAVSILLLLGVHLDQTVIMGVAAAVCSILVTLGVLSNPDTAKKGYGDDMYPCSSTGELEKHVPVNGQMVCEKCGSVYTPPSAAAPSDPPPAEPTAPAPPVA
jgi:uncharacterized membrane protein